MLEIGNDGLPNIVILLVTGQSYYWLTGRVMTGVLAGGCQQSHVAHYPVSWQAVAHTHRNQYQFTGAVKQAILSSDTEWSGILWWC